MNPVYLDHAATTPIRAEVRAAMAPYLDGVFGNPSSMHRWGREASAALEEARAVCAEAIGAEASEVRFVRGGTESDNLAILGRAAQLHARGVSPRVVVTAVEHRAVLGAAAAVTSGDPRALVILDVAPDGSLDLDELDRALAKGPALVSVMWVNNETGMVLDVSGVAERTASAGATLHTDAVQAAGKVRVRVDEVAVDLLTVSGHKLGGPNGTGLLFVRAGTQMVPVLHGGGQERGLRPGTEDVAGAVGLASALRLAVLEREEEATRLAALRDDLEERLAARIEGLRMNASTGTRAPHVCSAAIPGVDGRTLLMALDLEGVAVSGGSACGSGATKESHVIAALYGPDDPYAVVRYSFGRTTRADDVATAADVTAAVVGRLRAVGSVA